MGGGRRGGMDPMADLLHSCVYVWVCEIVRESVRGGMRFSQVSMSSSGIFGPNQVALLATMDWIASMSSWCPCVCNCYHHRPLQYMRAVGQLNIVAE